MKKGQYFIIGAALIAMIIIPSFILLSEIQTEDSTSVCTSMFYNLKDQFKNTIDLTVENNNSLENLEDNLETFSDELDSFCTGSLYCNISYDIEQISSGSSEDTLFEDDFEGYSHISGLDLYDELEDNGWIVYDYTHPIPDDDIYLNQEDSNYYAVIQDRSYIAAEFNTTDYSNITLQYDRRTDDLENYLWYDDEFEISWRVGDSGGLTSLEQTHDTSWETKEWTLSGAENESLVQVRFYLDADDNDDYGHVDDVIITGFNDGEADYNVSLNFTFKCGDMILEDSLIYSP